MGEMRRIVGNVVLAAMPADAGYPMGVIIIHVDVRTRVHVLVHVLMHVQLKMLINFSIKVCASRSLHARWCRSGPQHQLDILRPTLAQAGTPCRVFLVYNVQSLASLCEPIGSFMYSDW